MNDKEYKTNSIHKELPIVILCGGKSSRMGEDKALLPFKNSSSLAQFQYERLKISFSNVSLSCKRNKFNFKAPLVLETNTIYSPLVALESILEQIKSDKVFIISVDTPLVKINSINKIISSSKDYEITVAKTEYLHSLCGVFSKSILPTIKKMLDKDFHKIGALLKKSNTKIISFNNEDEFINLNNPSEYKRSLTLI